MKQDDDFRLRMLLKEWTVSDCPPGVEDRIAQARNPWWKALLTGYVRIPVPVAVCATAMLIAAAWMSLGSTDLVRCLAATSPPAVENCQPNVKC